MEVHKTFNKWKFEMKIQFQRSTIWKYQNEIVKLLFNILSTKCLEFYTKTIKNWNFFREI